MKRICKTFLFFCLIFPITLIAEGDEETYQFKGIHYLASYCECDPGALSDVEKLKAAMYYAVEKSGATTLDAASWVFPPCGLTMVFLLSESHASIHTYPEHGSCFVDLFTCGNKCSAEKFDAALRKYLKPKVVHQRTLLRNEGIQDKG